MREFEAIEMIRAGLGKKQHPDLLLGIGDDAAIFDRKSPWAITTDHLVENVHFLRSATPASIVQKLVRCNVSDLAAMGAEPIFALTNAAIPAEKGLPRRWKNLKEQLIQAHFKELNAWKIDWIGGDTTSSPLLMMGMTLLGRPMVPGVFARRSGAKIGDAIFVTGTLGGSLLGRHLSFEPRLKEARWLMHHARPHSMMDVSDGIAMDLRHICEESKVGANLNEASIPVSAAAKKMARRSGKSPVEHALTDGEDFELLFTIAPDQAKKLSRFPFPCGVTQIGTVQEKKRGLTWQTTAGDLCPFDFKGYEHA